MEGQRVDKSSGGKVWLILGIVLAVFLGIYLGVSIWLGTWERVYPNVSVAGVDVSGLTLNTAKYKLDKAFAPEDQVNREQMVEVWYGDYTGYLSADAFAVDTRASARQALQAGREMLLLNGVEYLRSLLGTSRELDPAAVSLTEGGIEELGQVIWGANEAMDVEQPNEGYQVDLEGAVLTLTKGYTQRAVDQEATWDTIRQSYVSELMGKNSPALMTVNEQAPWQPDFQQIHGELYVQMKEAEYDPATGLVSEHAVGVDFDTAQAQTTFDNAAEGEVVRIPLEVEQPKNTKQGLEEKLFADLLGEATSRVSGIASRRANVRISSGACSGVILMPGEEFSYNDLVTTRNAEPYQSAPVYVNGKTVYETGGGLCQASSTLYLALLHTTLEIVERHNHGYAVDYVPDGMDATVYFGSQNFRFKNNTNYPLKVVAEYYEKNGKNYLNMKILGTNEDGRYAIPSHTVYDWVQPTTTYVPKEEIPQGTTQVDKEQNSYTGRKAHTYRTIYEADGTKVVTEDLGVSKYRMRPEIVYYNPQDGDPANWVDGVPPQPKPENEESVLPEMPTENPLNPVTPDSVVEEPVEAPEEELAEQE